MHKTQRGADQASGWIRLAPVYDFVQMEADPEGVTRTTTWDRRLKKAVVTTRLKHHVEPEHLLDELGGLAWQLRGLREGLAARAYWRAS